MIVKLLWLFLVYSFVGWVLETVAAAIRQKRFVNRGIINGPFCITYGISGCIITVFTGELHGIWLFLGSMILASLVQWISGHLIERMYHERWWDYSRIKWNLDGYISLPTSCIWGLFGIFVVRIGNKCLYWIYHAVPHLVMLVVVIVCIVLVGIDALATLVVLSGQGRNTARWKEMDEHMKSISRRLAEKIYTLVNYRLNRAYPHKRKVQEDNGDGAVFAYGCGFYKIVMLFFTGAFLGDLTETVFCKITTGMWMSRSSVVWGDFSIVWGLAIAAVTAMLYKYRNRSDSFLFWMGTFLGGAYEYICSVFTEIAFGTVFWDYSHMPFNLGGRINLLFCFFWGIASVAWFKKIYPFLSGLIEKIPVKAGKWMTWILIVFMAVDVSVTCAALVRYNERNEKKEAQTFFDVWMDETFDDARMKRIFPNAKTKEEVMEKRGQN